MDSHTKGVGIFRGFRNVFSKLPLRAESGRRSPKPLNPIVQVEAMEP